jgi:hypothetical protein
MRNTAAFERRGNVPFRQRRLSRAAPARGHRAHRHHLGDAHREIGAEAALLRHIADAQAAALGRFAKEPDRARGQWNETQDRGEQGRLARAVGPDQGDEIAGFERDADVLEHDAAVALDRDMLAVDDRSQRKALANPSATRRRLST